MQSKKDMEIVKDTIRNEREGLSALLSSVDDSVGKSVEALYKNKGKIIVIGIGKSGHIGKKISATLSSTGSPSQYINCAEANHGDLGMIENDDIILALSKSGEANEMVNILNYAKRSNIKIISITCNKNSFLAKNSNLTCLLPEISEACKLNLAPTTSTTMMLALGDGLAIALMIRKNFKQADFKKLHPGGMLGHSLLEVKNLMHKEKDMPIISDNSNMREALIEMTSKRFGCVGIVDKNFQFVGIITDGDLRRNIYKNFLGFSAKVVMTPKPKLIDKNELMLSALKIMNKNKITCLFVVEKKSKTKPVGIIHIHDCIKIG